MLVPKRTKYRKMQKGNNRGIGVPRLLTSSFGDFALQATEPGRLTARQIEAARMAITRHVKRAGKLWIRIFPHRPVTKKPLEVRMGGGKGGVEEWAADIQPGPRHVRDLGRRREDGARSVPPRRPQAPRRLQVPRPRRLVRAEAPGSSQSMKAEETLRERTTRGPEGAREEPREGHCSTPRFKNFTNRLDDTSTIRKTSAISRASRRSSAGGADARQGEAQAEAKVAAPRRRRRRPRRPQERGEVVMATEKKPPAKARAKKAAAAKSAAPLSTRARAAAKEAATASAARWSARSSRTR